MLQNLPSIYTYFETNSVHQISLTMTESTRRGSTVASAISWA